MSRNRLSLPSPALVLSLMALFVALGGTGYAATQVVEAGHAAAKKKSSHADSAADKKLVKALAPSLSVASAKKASTAISAGHATTADSATNATNAGHATTADSATNAVHANSADSAPFPQVLPSGKSLTGNYTIAGAGSGVVGEDSISFEFPLASPPTPVIVPQGGTNPDPAHCSGSSDAPVAAPGFLCIYEGYSENVGYLGECNPDGHVDGTANRYGACVVAHPASTTVRFIEQGVWVVTGS